MLYKYSEDIKTLSPQTKCTQLLFRNCAFKGDVSTSVMLWRHNYEVTTLNHNPSMVVVAKTPEELRRKYSSWCLLGSVRADQSEQTWCLGEGALKRQALKWRWIEVLQQWTVWKIRVFFCVFFLVETKNKIMKLMISIIWYHLIVRAGSRV